MPRHIITLTGILLFTSHASGDSWPPAQVQARASLKGEFVVRIVPGKSMGDVLGYSGAPRGPYATAEWYRFDGSTYRKRDVATLLNPIAPVDIEVTASGSLITLDNWHNLGVGYAVAVYSPEGKIVKAYNLTDLYSPTDLAKIERTVSSFHWRCEGRNSAWLEKTDRELWVDDKFGGRFVFQVSTGAFEYQRGSGGCKR